MKLLGRLLALLVVSRAALRRLFGRREELPQPSETVPAGEARPPDIDADPTEREVPSNQAAENLVAFLLVLAAVFGFGFVAVYVVLETNAQWLGATIGGMLLALAAAALVAGKLVVPQETEVEERDPLLKEEQAEEVVEMVRSGGEGVSRRALIAGAGTAAGAAFVAAAATPIASLGPRLTNIHSTPWHAGVRLVDDHGRPYLADDIELGSMYTALPEHGDPEELAAGLIVVRLPRESIHLPPARSGWTPDGILAYSKVCPHAACAISLYRYPTYAPTSTKPAFTCPCHYSTFLPSEGGRLIFGPAGRALPQLPLMIDVLGYLRAAGPFHEDVGPSWWNVHRSQS